MDPIKISDCMLRQFISLSPEMDVVDAATLLIKYKSIGAPVVNDGGCLIGWVSEQDCLAVVSQDMYFSDRQRSVEDIMSTEVMTAKPNDTILDVAERMSKEKPKSYPVISDECHVLGVVTRHIVLKKMCERINNPQTA